MYKRDPINMVASSSRSVPDFLASGGPAPLPASGSSSPASNNTPASNNCAQVLGLATLLAQLFVKVAANQAATAPASPDSFTAAPPSFSPPHAYLPPKPTPPQAPVPRRRRPSQPVIIRRQSTRLAAKDKGKFVDMTDKAVKKKALEDALAGCTPALRDHVQRRGLLSR